MHIYFIGMHIFVSVNSFSIQNLIMDRKYLLNMNLSVCMETSDLSDCVYSIVIFHNTILPKQLCSMEMPYFNPSELCNDTMIKFEFSRCEI